MHLNSELANSTDYEIIVFSGDHFVKPHYPANFTMASVYRRRNANYYWWCVHFMQIEDGEAFEGANLSGCENHTTLDEALLYARQRAADEAGVEVSVS